MTITVWVIIALLILANTFYVAAEFAAVGVRRSRIRRMAEDGNGLARRMLPFVQHPAELDRYVAVSQVGITLSSLILGAVGQATVAVALAPYAATLLGLDAHTAANAAAITVLIVLTATQVLVGELIPKSVALTFPTEVALATVLPMRWSLAAFRPFITLLNGSATGLLRLFGIHVGAHRHLHSPDEIALLIAESRDGGLLEPKEQQRLQKALRLGRKTASDLMVPRDKLHMIDVDASWDAALEVVAASSFSRLPAYRGSRDRIVGVLRVKDLVLKHLAARTPPAIETLVRPFARVPAALPGDQVVALLRDKRAHQAAVVDASGSIVGFITIQDVLSQFLGMEGARS